MRLIAGQNARVELTERAAKELEIASAIQMSVLPVEFAIPGLEAAARMIPADEIGGDYYDTIPVPGGCWIAIGDVAGHGMRAGLTMLQVQSALAALVRQAPNSRPVDLWSALNATFYDTVRKRLGHDEHMTLSLLRYHDDGQFELVGAHEELVIWRSATETPETIPLTGTWVGLAQVAPVHEQRFRLGRGDVLVLYTDGIIEARDRKSGQMLGLDEVRNSLGRTHARSVEEIRDAIFDLTASSRRDDDASVLVFRYVGSSVAAVA
jgi:sigma-B regulation protein RsbU (phosphoserine phosphatase)